MLDFYKSKEYIEKQSLLMKKNWQSGVFNLLRRREMRKCKRNECEKSFEVIPADPKLYCSRSCAAKINNRKRGSLPDEVKLKISNSLKGTISPFRGVKRVPVIQIKCADPACNKLFFGEQWAHRKFCSNQCAMNIIGREPTSPKAARGKSGIRKDISNTAYFYSRWEANLARIFNYLGIKWIHQPKSFDLSSQTYTPDFYLPDYHLYIEVKNFLGDYSRLRDEKFRILYPNLKLDLFLKEDYLEIEKIYAPLIKNWEYKNSK